MSLARKLPDDIRDPHYYETVGKVAALIEELDHIFPREVSRALLLELIEDAFETADSCIATAEGEN